MEASDNTGPHYSAADFVLAGVSLGEGKEGGREKVKGEGERKGRKGGTNEWKGRRDG